MIGSATAQAQRTVHADVHRVWDVVTDWPRHGALLPGTRLHVDGPAGVGQRITAVTAIGLRFEDPMVVGQWDPPLGGGPGCARLDKVGRVLTGWAQIEVRPLSAATTELTWREELGLAGRTLGPLSRVPTGLMIGRLVAGLAREAERAS